MELTGDNVTECLGGMEDIVEDQLHQRYTTALRSPVERPPVPLDLAFRAAEFLRDWTEPARCSSMVIDLETLDDKTVRDSMTVLPAFQR